MARKAVGTIESVITFFTQASDETAQTTFKTVRTILDARGVMTSKRKAQSSKPKVAKSAGAAGFVTGEPV